MPVAGLPAAAALGILMPSAAAVELVGRVTVERVVGVEAEQEAVRVAVRVAAAAAAVAAAATWRGRRRRRCCC